MTRPPVLPVFSGQALAPALAGRARGASCLRVARLHARRLGSPAIATTPAHPPPRRLPGPPPALIASAATALRPPLLSDGLRFVAVQIDDSHVRILDTTTGRTVEVP